MSDENLAAAAKALNAPEAIVKRSAEARAKATGMSAEEVLAAWAGGGAVASPAAPEATPPTVPEEEETAEGGQQAAAEPAAEVPEGEQEAPAPAPVPAAVVVAPAPAAAAPAVAAPAVPPILEGRKDSHWRLLVGVAALLTLGLIGAWMLPAADAVADARPRQALSESAQVGREVYLREGCVYCHTQLVRPVVTDAELGPVSTPGSIGGYPGDTIGVARYGQDLTHIGSRDGVDTATLTDYLRDPQAARPGSLMPPFAHLSEEDLAALVQYLVESK